MSVVTAPSSNHIRTYTGGWINPLDPSPYDFLIDDIAHSLSLQCRFTGHVTDFYSVGQHSVLVAYQLMEKYNDDKLAYEGLMHDASEAYLSDIARPVKRSSQISTFYDEAEGIIMDAIAKKFGITWPMLEEVKWADDVLLRTEQRDLMHGATYEGDFWWLGDEPITTWEPKLAEAAFIEVYENLRPR